MLFLDLGLVVLHKQEIRCQGTLRRIRVVRLAFLCTSRVAARELWWGSYNRRNTCKLCAPGQGRVVGERQRNTPRMVFGQKRVELCDVCTLQLLDTVLERVESIDELRGL